jgi:PAS domain S-box-containing protein
LTRSASTEARRVALGVELQWLAGLTPFGGGAPLADDGLIADDRVAAIVATALLALPSNAVDEPITRALAAVGLQRGVDRAFYYRLESEARALVLTHEWHEPGMRPLGGVQRFSRLPLEVLPVPFQETLRRGGVLRLPRTHQFLDVSVEGLVAPDGDRALVLVPVVAAGELLGVAGFAAACGTVWQEGDMQLLQVVAHGVARAVERRGVDEALRASEGRFRAMCDTSPLGIFLAGPSGECRYVNPAGQAIMGLDAAEAQGRGWIRGLHPEDRERIVAGWGSAVDSRVGYETSIHRFLHADGNVVSVEVRAVPVVGPMGERGFLGILEDVSARVRAEEERRDLLARAETARAEAEGARAEVAHVLERISDGFLALDGDNRFTYANDRALALLGRAREEIIGQRCCSELLQIWDGPFEEAYHEAVRTQRATTLEARTTKGNGRWYDVRIYPSATGVSLFFDDVSDRKRHEEELTDDREYLRQELGGLEVFSEVVGLDPGLRRVMESVDLVAGTNANVLVTGETGTGKELVARAIHERSPRRDRLLVKVNCAAISAGLVESELFGHEKGAFTGAVQRRKGRFELAHGGTLFLDEVGELPLETQVKLLRVLQEREFERVGGSDTVRVDVRVVAATNRNLPELVARGRFREDLYYRLAVFPVTLPPLRERAADVPLLVHSFLRRFAREAGKRIIDVAPEAMERLVAYRWPGNVRELQNVIERAVILARRPILDLASLPDLTGAAVERLLVGDGVATSAGAIVVPVSVPVSVPVAGAASAAPGATPGPIARTMDEVEREYVAEVLAETSWVIEGERGAARRLGLHPNTLRSRLKRWGWSRPEPATRTA